MPRDERSQRYTRLIADIALRTMSEVRAATAPQPGLVQKITLNGRVQGTATSSLATRDSSTHSYRQTLAWPGSMREYRSILSPCWK